jgi:hypothetical protein
VSIASESPGFQFCFIRATRYRRQQVKRAFRLYLPKRPAELRKRSALPIILVLYSNVIDRTCKRQQFVDAAVGPGGQFFQGISKSCDRIESVEFGRSEQSLDGSGPLTSPFRASEQPVLFAEAIGRMAFSTGLLSIGKWLVPA